MVVGFDKEKLVRMVRSKAWLGLYIIITEASKTYEHALGESE